MEDKDKRIAELTMMLRDVHDPLLISEALLRKHGYAGTADMVNELRLLYAERANINRRFDELQEKLKATSPDYRKIMEKIEG